MIQRLPIEDGRGRIWDGGMRLVFDREKGEIPYFKSLGVRSVNLPKTGYARIVFDRGRNFVESGVNREWQIQFYLIEHSSLLRNFMLIEFDRGRSCPSPVPGFVIDRGKHHVCRWPSTPNGPIMLIFHVDKWDTTTWNVMVHGFFTNGKIDEAMKLHRDVVSWTTMLDGYCSIGDVDGDRWFFYVMPAGNLYSWNAMIGGYSHNNRSPEALACGNMFDADDEETVSLFLFGDVYKRFEDFHSRVNGRFFIVVALTGLLGAVRAQERAMIDSPRMTIANGLVSKARENIDPDAHSFARKVKEIGRQGLTEGYAGRC